jgi:uncharacterized membrane protein
MTRNGADRRDAKPAPEQRAELTEGLAKLAEGDPQPKVSLGARLRNYFLTGLVVVGPVTITLYIAKYVIDAVDRFVKPYIPAVYNPDTYLPFALPGFGLLFAIILLTMIGALAANLIGRWIISAGEVMLSRMPVVRNVYRGTKQIFESVVTASAPNQQAFQKVAVMQFPSPGIWAIVFITGEAANEIRSISPDQDLVSVFMPTHLLPPSGFVVFVPRSSVTPVDLTVEDAAKIIISAGMVNPKTQKRLQDLAQAARNGERTGGRRAPTPVPETSAGG